MLIQLETIKQHLRIDVEESAVVDAELERLHDAAIDYASNFLGRPIPWKVESDDATVTEVFPKSVEQAVLILIAEYYDNREQHVTGTIVAEIPSVERLLHFYRVGLGV